jgi:hypothetical protein
LFGDTFERVLTEDSSVQIALSINPDILKYFKDLEYASQRIRESISLYFPKINLNLNLSKMFNNSNPIIISGELYNDVVCLPDSKKDLYYSIRFSVWQNVYSGGKIKITNKLAKINMDKVKSEWSIIKNNVINTIKRTFNDCLYRKELLNFYNLKIKNTEKKKIYLTHSELNDFIRKSVIEQFNYKKEILNLLNAIGMDLNMIIDISGTLSPKMKNFDLEKCLLLSYQFKSEIKMLQDQEVLDGLMLNLLSMQKYPSISVGAVQEWFGDKNNYYFSINANIPIFDGGSSLARIRQGRIKIREMAIRRVKLENEIMLNVRHCFLEYNFWREQAIIVKLLERDGKYNETDIEIIHNLNKSYYNLELAVGVELDSC